MGSMVRGPSIQVSLLTLPRQTGILQLTMSPSLLGKPRADPRFPLALQHVGVTSCWGHRARSRTFPISGVSSHPR